MPLDVHRPKGEDLPERVGPGPRRLTSGPVYWRALLSLVLMLGLLQPATAQKKDRDRIRADKYYRQQLWAQAIVPYERSLQREYHALSCARLAECYLKGGDYLLAEHWYKQAVVAEVLPPEHYLLYAKVLRANGKSEQARPWFERYDRYTGTRGSHYDSYALESAYRGVEPEFRVAAIARVNSPFSEIAPVFFNGNLVFASNRPVGKGSNTSTVQYDLYLSELEIEQPVEAASRTFREPVPVRGPINSAWNDAGLSPDARSGEVWLSRSASGGERRLRNGEGAAPASLYTAGWKAGRLSRIHLFAALPRDVDALHPSLSPDGNRLYFAAQLPGGYGGMDIWYCDRLDPSGTSLWSAPINAGSRVNTSGQELYPYAASMERIYFASDGHPGLGGMDLYYSDYDGLSWGPPQHLPPPINSARDDMGLFVLNNQGFFSSDRLGGEGGDDLYALERISGRLSVRALDAQTGIALSGVQVELISDGIENLTQSTDARGTAVFDLKPGQRYYLSLIRTGYESTVFTDTRNRDQISVYLSPLASQPEAQPGGQLQVGDGQQAGFGTAPRYRIRIGVYRRPDLERLEGLSTLAPLFSEKHSNQTTVFYLGPLTSPEVARWVLEQVQQQGYPDAFMEDWPE
jgi:hypothetical protein